jgi:hypothetical protein
MEFTHMISDTYEMCHKILSVAQPNFVFLTYFPNMKVGLSNHQSVSLCDNVWTDW